MNHIFFVRVFSQMRMLVHFEGPIRKNYPRLFWQKSSNWNVHLTMCPFLEDELPGIVSR